MRKIIDRTGQIFGGLKIIEELGNKQVKCQCVICGRLISEKIYDKRTVLRGTVKSCGCLGSPYVQHKVGQTFGGLTIVQELGGGRVRCKCEACGKEKEYNKSAVVNKKQLSCGCLSPKKFVNRTGEIYNGITILEELGNNKVRGLCPHCGNDQKIFSKDTLIKGGYKSCGCIPAGFVNRIGETYNNITVVRELGGNKVIGLCNICNREETYSKGTLIAGETKCKYKDCSNKGAMIYRVGQQFDTLVITKELGENKVLARCTECNKEYTYTKDSIVRQNKKCDCQVKNIIINRVGETYNNLTILKELGYGKVLAECGICGHTDTYSKNEVVKGHRCRNKNCDNSRGQVRRIKSVGEIKYGFIIVDNPREGKITATCIKCNTTSEYTRQNLLAGRSACGHCGLRGKPRTIEGRTICNVVVKSFNHVGRSGQPWYNCECIHCGKQELLRYDQIFTYECDKKST